MWGDREIQAWVGVGVQTCRQGYVASELKRLDEEERLLNSYCKKSERGEGQRERGKLDPVPGVEFASQGIKRYIVA